MGVDFREKITRGQNTGQFTLRLNIYKVYISPSSFSVLSWKLKHTQVNEHAKVIVFISNLYEDFLKSSNILR